MPTAINEREQEVVYGRIWREEREGRNYGIIISKIKNVFNKHL